MSNNDRYNWFNTHLFNAIPASAVRILDVGCDTGLLGLELKKQNPDRFVSGVELNPETAALAEECLDEVHVLNLEHEDADALGDQFDAIILGDVLEHLINPIVTLKKLRELLSDTGAIYTSIPNIQHYSIFRRLLKGDFQYRETGLLDSTHVRFFCQANIIKLMLDAGLLPKLDQRILKDDAQLAGELGPLLVRLGLSKAALKDMETFQYQHICHKQPPPKSAAKVPLSFVVHSQFTGVLKDNFYSSPIIRSKHPHQISIYRKPMALVDAWNEGLSKAKHEYVVFVREHMYLPDQWDLRLADQIEHINSICDGDWIAGAAGVKLKQQDSYIVCGATLVPGQNTLPDQERLREVDFLDDNIIVMPARTALKLDPKLGGHLHGTDLALRMREQGGRVFALPTPCLENGPYTNRMPPGFEQSKKAIKAKWPSEPVIATSLGPLS